MNATHTPGPWRVMPEGETFYRTPNGERQIRNVGGYTRIVATAHGPSGLIPTPTEAEANARLIAEAPAMRAELSETLDILRTIIDSGALKTATNVPTAQADAIRLEIHERIASTRAILARIDGGTTA